MATGTQTFPIAYSYAGHSTVPPPMSIMPYFNTYSPTDATQADPDGWVVCNGQTRTASDNRFSVVAPILNRLLNVSTNTSNSITPPDLRGMFLYGMSNTTSLPVTGGSSSATLTTANLPAHSHTITDPGHTHANTATQNSHTHTGTVFNSGSGSTGFVPSSDYSAGSNSLTSVAPAITMTNASATTGITATNNTGTGTAFSILPPYMAINYIMKY